MTNSATSLSAWKSARRILKAISVWSVLGATFVVIWPHSRATADTLTLAGSTTFNTLLMVPYKNEIEIVAGHKLIVIPNKTGLGLQLLLERRVDLAMISAPLEKMLSRLRQIDPNWQLERLRSFEIYRTRVAFAVHPSNPVRSASLETMRRVLLGEIANWQELGGPNLPIRLVTVRDDDGVQQSVEAQVLRDRNIAATNLIRVRFRSEVDKVLEQEPTALGFVQLEGLKRHTFFEIATDDAIEQHLSLVSLGEPTPVMRAVIEAARKMAAAKLR